MCLDYEPTPSEATEPSVLHPFQDRVEELPQKDWGLWILEFGQFWSSRDSMTGQVLLPGKEVTLPATKGLSFDSLHHDHYRPWASVLSPRASTHHSSLQVAKHPKAKACPLRYFFGPWLHSSLSPKDVTIALYQLNVAKGLPKQGLQNNHLSARDGEPLAHPFIMGKLLAPRSPSCSSADWRGSKDSGNRAGDSSRPCGGRWGNRGSDYSQDTPGPRTGRSW